MSTTERKMRERGERGRSAKPSADEARLADWQALHDSLPEREAPFTTVSGREVEPLYTQSDRAAEDSSAIGLPGFYPFTRGPYATMYRTRLWTMRQFAG